MRTPSPNAAAPPDDEAEFEEIFRSLGRADTSTRGLSRRRFLMGAAAAGGIAAMDWGPFAKAARAAAPLGPTDPILVVILLGGGNDGLNTLIPATDPMYAAAPDALRRDISVLAGSHALGFTGFALHPSLPRLAQRWRAGKVAAIRGVGQPAVDLNHGSCLATWMAGTASTSRTTGWIGRYLDTVPDSDQGLRGIVVDSFVPLHFLGESAEVTGLGGAAVPFGSMRRDLYRRALYDAIARFDDAATGRGALADRVAATGQTAMDRAVDLAAVLPEDYSAPAGTLVSQLDITARVINANLGAKVLGVTSDSYDTHSGQLTTHGIRLDDLDAGIEQFYATLDPAWADRVVLMTFSEFGQSTAHRRRCS